MSAPRIATALISAALFAAGCGSGAGTAPGTAAGAGGAVGPDKVTLTLNWYPYGEHAAFYYGVEQGIFAKYGIDLSIQAGRGSGSTVQEVGAGRTDFGWADTPALLQAVSKGIPVRSLGVYLQTTPASVQFFTAEGISRPKGLKGRRIAGTAGDALSKTFPVFLARNGLSLSDVTVQNTDAAGKISSVIAGKADALIGNANDQGPAIHGKTGRQVTVMRFSDYGLNYYSDGLIASTAELAKTGLVSRMVQATSEAWSEASAHPQDAVAAMSGSSAQVPPAPVLLEQFDTTLTLLHTAATAGLAPGADAPADWQATVGLMAQAGLIPSAQPITAYWDESAALKG